MLVSELRKSLAEVARELALGEGLPRACFQARAGGGDQATPDRESQYASEHDRVLLARHGIVCIMSRRANGWENAPMDCLFATPKKELVHDEGYATSEEARASLLEFIEVSYNRIRRHSSPGYLSPAEYERAG